MNIFDRLYTMMLSTYLFEMAFSKKELQSDVKSLAKQIVENWVLIRYSRIKNSNSLDVNHWKTELFAHLENIYDMYYKGNKYNAISEVLIDKMELNKYEHIHLLMLAKCKKENISFNDEYLIESCIDLSSDLVRLMRLISAKQSEETYDELIDYVENM